MAASSNAKKLKELRSRAGYSVRALAKKLGWGHTRVQYYEDTYKGALLPQHIVTEMAPHFIGRGSPPISDREVYDLAGMMAPSAIADPGMHSMDEETPPPVQRIVPITPSIERPDVPVWASAEAGSDGTIVLTAEPIDWIRRSERMLHVRNPFSFHVIGGSMSPAIEHGDQVVINPAATPRPGNDCVFTQQQPDGTILALVKRLLRVGGDAWRVRQFSEPRDFDLSRRKWTKALVVSEIRRGGV